MAGLVPTIDVFDLASPSDLDARHKPGMAVQAECIVIPNNKPRFQFTGSEAY